MNIKNIVYALVAILILSCSKDDEPKLNPAKFSIDQSTVDFGEVEIPTLKEIKLTVTNSGEEDLILKNYTFSGSNASEFTVNASETEEAVQAGKTYEFVVALKPTEAGDKTATLTITSNVGEHKINLSGKGTPEPVAVFSINPESENFGEVEVDATASQTFKITNTGNADLTILATTLSNTTDFNTDLTNQTITPGEFYEFSVVFKPAAEGVKTATIKLTTNIGEYTINLEGNATPKPVAVYTITPENNNFGDVEVDAMVSQTFKITNTGNADLIISAATLSNTTDFNTDLTNQTITPEGFYEFYVVFKPTTEGAKATTIRLTTNIGEYTVNIEGNATPKTIVNIPDANFKEALLAHGKSITGSEIGVIDVNNDGEIQITEAEAYNGAIKCNNKAIYDASGIEAFINLTKLNISSNQLTGLDVSKNINLTELNCAVNKIAQLDISKNTKLKALYCSYNRIKNLDVSGNYYLIALYCTNNWLTRLNIFNASNGLTYMLANNNPNLTCIRVASGFTPPDNWVKDSTANYSSYCP